MNYQGVWIHSGNYGRILLVGDIYVNSIVSSLQKECTLPVDAVYANDLDTLEKRAQLQMQQFSYRLVIICEGDIDGGSASSLLPKLRGAYARSQYMLLTAPPAWLKKEKYRRSSATTAQYNQQCREMADRMQVPCIDQEAIAHQFRLESESSATYPKTFFTRVELKRLHFSKARKIRKADSEPGGRIQLTMRFFAFQIADGISQLIGKKATGEILWDNLQTDDNAPFLLIGDSNIRRIRSGNRELRNLSNALSMSADVASEMSLAQITSILTPQHKVIGVCIGTHHLSEHYSEAFENRIRALFNILGANGRKVVVINILQRATEKKPHVPDTGINKIIQSLNNRVEAVAREFGFRHVDAYSIMNGKTFEDKVHYMYDDYTELSSMVLRHLKDALG